MAASDDIMSYLLKLTSGQPPGTRIPSERDLAQRLGIARNTARVTIQHLVAAGRLTARQGSGLYVAEPKATVCVGEPTSRLFDGAEYHPFEYQVLDSRDDVASPELAGAIQADSDEHIIEYRRLLIHESVPAAVESSTVARSATTGLTGAAFFNLLDSVRATSTTTISCGLAVGEFSRLLQIPAGQPLLVVERVHKVPPADTLAYIKTSYRADRLRLSAAGSAPASQVAATPPKRDPQDQGTAPASTSTGSHRT